MNTTHQNLSTSRLIQSLILLVTCIIIADAFIANTPTSSKQLIHRYPPVKNTIPSNENTHLYSTHKHKIRMSSQTDQPEWDPETQIYKDGIVPAHHSMSMTMEELLSVNQGKLKIFGYGSLCWHPGSEGVLSLASIEEDEHDHDESDDATHPNTTTARPKRKVTTDPGRAIGYQRCWAQRSADHRGTPQFNGIVCTLLSDEEVWKLHNGDDKDVNNDESIDDVTNAEKKTMQSISNMRPSMTEGLIYTVDAELVEDCLAELDFREKGGYARDVIDVIEDETGNIVKALLYRGTTDNPAFWKRVFLDLPLAAAIIAVAIGPSGHNDVYLFHLDTFLSHITQHSSAAALTLKDHSGDDRTGELAKMVKLLQTEYRPYFLFGAGSNEHNQLLMPRVGSASNSSSDGLESDGQIVAKDSLDIKEVHELAEMLLVVPRQCENNDASSVNVNHKPLSLHAGGGHSALLTRGGMLYLWGWNQAGQLGRLGDSFSKLLVEGAALSESSPLAYIPPLSNIKVATVSLGHTHTLVIEKDTGRLFGFGENGRGQVDGFIQGNTPIGSWHKPRTPLSLSEDYFVDAAAGLFHSAAITNEGELVTWGCGRFGQCLQLEETKGEYVSNTTTIGRWKTPDGSKLVHVVCGRRHTAILDELGRVWTLGDNKYGQLGRVESSSTSLSKTPQLVEGPLGQAGSGCFAIMNGWSHILALVRSENSEDITLYGWGRNDKGQLGMRSGKGSITKPTSLSNNSNVSIIQSACCGSESSHVLDVKNNIWGCGWNEHGNLGIGRYHQQDNNDYECCWTLETVTGTRLVAPPPSVGEGRIFAAGGAHLIVMAT